MLKFLQIILVYTIISCTPSNSIAQSLSFKWAKSFSSIKQDWARSTVVDNAGNVYVGGFFSSTIDFDNGAGVFNMTAVDTFDAFIVKLDPNGNFINAIQFGGIGTQAVQTLKFDNNGNLIAVGNFNDIVDFDPSASVFNLTSNAIYTGFGSTFVVKLNTSLNFINAIKIDDCRLYNFTVDLTNNIILNGDFFTVANVDFDPSSGVFNLPIGGSTLNTSTSDLVIVKLSSNFNFVWAKKITSKGSDTYGDIVTDSAKNIYVIGITEDSTDFDPSPNVALVSGNYSQTFLLKLDENGIFNWVKIFKCRDVYSAMRIAIDKTNKLIFSGSFRDSCDLDAGTGVNMQYSNSINNYKVHWFAKYDLNGNFIWAKTLQTEDGGIFNIKIDQFNSIYLAGDFSNYLQVDPNNSNILLNYFGSGTAFFAKYNSSGNYIWAKGIGNPIAGQQSDYIANSIFVDNNLNVYGAGSVKGVTDYDPTPAVYAIPNVGDFDAYVFKWSNCPFVTYDTLQLQACNNTIINGTTYTTSGTYLQTLTNAFGCDSLLTIKLLLGGSIKYDTVKICNSYTWQGNNYTTSGIYKDTLQGIYGCDSISVLNLTIYNKSYTTLNQSICFGQNYLGYNTTGVYLDTLTNVFGCDSIRTINLSVKPRIVNTLYYTICDGQTYLGYTTTGTYSDTFHIGTSCDSIRILNLTVNQKKRTIKTINICEGQTYFAGGFNQFLSGIYFDTLQTYLGCDSVIETRLTVNQKPVVNIVQDKNLCNGSFANLQVNSNNNSILWSNGSTANTIAIMDTGKYYVTVTNAIGCKNTDTINVSQKYNPPINFLKPKDSVCVTLGLEIFPNSLFNNYLWSTGSTLNKIKVNSAGFYHLIVTNINGCIGNDTIEISNRKCLIKVYVPTAFTPNNDGVNDVFKVGGGEAVKDFKLSVFNRWGTKIFETNAIQNFWNGTFNNKPQPTGAYIYFVEYKDAITNEQSNMKGTVVLVR